MMGQRTGMLLDADVGGRLKSRPRGGPAPPRAKGEKRSHFGCTGVRIVCLSSRVPPVPGDACAGARSVSAVASRWVEGGGGRKWSGVECGASSSWAQGCLVVGVQVRTYARGEVASRPSASHPRSSFPSPNSSAVETPPPAERETARYDGSTGLRFAALHGSSSLARICGSLVPPRKDTCIRNAVVRDQRGPRPRREPLAIKPSEPRRVVRGVLIPPCNYYVPLRVQH